MGKINSQIAFLATVKRPSGTAGQGNIPDCCLVSLCFLCDIHSIHSISSLKYAYDDNRQVRPNAHSSKDHDGRSETDAFSNEWVVHLVGGGDVADLTALRLGYLNIGEV